MNVLKKFAMDHYGLVDPTDIAKKFAQIANAEGKIYSYEGDGDLTVGTVLYDGEEGSETLAPAGTIPLEDGSRIVVGEEGLVEELIPAGEEEAPEEEAALQTPTAIEETVVTKTSFEGEEGANAPETNLEAILFAVAEVVTPLSDSFAALSERVDALEGTASQELESVQTELASAKKEVTKLAAMPAAESHKVTKSVPKSKTGGSKFEKLKASGKFNINTINK